jgi:hypothetical protein
MAGRNIRTFKPAMNSLLCKPSLRRLTLGYPLFRRQFSVGSVVVASGLFPVASGFVGKNIGVGIAVVPKPPYASLSVWKQFCFINFLGGLS